MDLIYTNAQRVDIGVISAYEFDLSFGAEENDFEMTIGAGEASIESGAYIYIEGTEYGGIVDGIKASTNGETVTYFGRTWQGILNSKVIEPDSGADHKIVSDEANIVLSNLIGLFGLWDLMYVDESESGIDISNYKFARYCKGYDGIRAMLSAYGAKLKINWSDNFLHLWVEPIVDYATNPIDGDVAPLSVERHDKKVNHLICLGKGELAAREVIHLYIDQNGNVSNTRYFTGLDDITEIYDNSNSEDLRADGIKKLKELRSNDKAEISLPESEKSYDIGDIVGAMEIRTGVRVSKPVTQKIVKINNGAISTEYKTGG